MRSRYDISALVRFVVVTLGATAVLHLSLPLFGLRFSLSLTSPSLYLYLAGLAVPVAAALLLSGKGARRSFCRSVLRLRGSPITYVAALLAQLGMVLLAWLLMFASGSPVEPRASPSPGFALLAAGQIWVVLGEEPGWRGFALPRLESLMSPRLATLALALVWGFWHWPMFFVAGSLQAEVSPWLFSSSIFAWSAIHTALYHRSRPSVVPNLLFHASTNITLNTGLVPGGLEPYLLASYLVVGLGVWLAAARQGISGLESHPNR